MDEPEAVAVGQGGNHLVHALADPLLLEALALLLKFKHHVLQCAALQRFQDEVDPTPVLVPAEQAHDVRMIYLAHHHDLSLDVLDWDLHAAFFHCLYDALFPYSVLSKVSCAERARAQLFPLLPIVPHLVDGFCYEELSRDDVAPAKGVLAQHCKEEVEKLAKVQRLVGPDVVLLEHALDMSFLWQLEPHILMHHEEDRP
mmetsp:Transcript_88374/g.248966  ORF Transcript_88374/g.248966 Transcript_88374/m.248966 type:complete len:200 (+) Transcript_88374:1132-1731(+)